MANIKQSAKRARQAERHRQNNRWQKTRFNSIVKQVLTAIGAGDKTQAAATYQAAISVIDRLANKGLIHKNKAARHKSRLNTQIHAMA